MRVTIEIDCSGASYADNPDVSVAHVLDALVLDIYSNGLFPGTIPLYDIDGTAVGAIKVERVKLVA